MPLIPDPIDDETFGSWLERCAVSHRCGSRKQLVDWVLAFDGVDLDQTGVDWDTEPPPRVLNALSRRTRFSVADLQRLVVRRGPSVLRYRERDAYCPRRA